MRKRKKSSSNFHQSKAAFYLTFIVGLVGACAWLPTVIDFFKKSDLDIKVIEFYKYIQLNDSIDKVDNPNVDYDSKNYLIKLDVIAQNRNFNLKEIKMQGFDSMDSPIRMKVKLWTTFFYYSSQNMGRVEYAMTLKEDDYLTNRVSIFTNKSNLGFVGFTADMPIKMIKSIEIIFFDQKGNRIEKVINKNELMKSMKQDPVFL